MIDLSSEPEAPRSFASSTSARSLRAELDQRLVVRAVHRALGSCLVCGRGGRGARSRLDRRRSFKELVKRRGAPGASVDVILITHATSEHLVREALELIFEDGTIVSRAQVIRIERE